MVGYCCVKGCRNSKNKDPNSTATFHKFPTNLELRQKWLRAIGRPGWEPPGHIRICSLHFSSEMISRVKARTRILDQACPVNFLPLNSNLEASDVEVCRFCLASDVKIFSIQEGQLKKCMESVAAFNDNVNIEGLPQFVCYECGAQLMKFRDLLKKSMISQATLFGIYVQHGRVTKCQIKKQNRIELKLISSLQCYYETPTNFYEFKYDDKLNASHLLKTYSVHTSEKYQKIEGLCKEEKPEVLVKQCYETNDVESFEGLEEVYMNNVNFTNDSNDEISPKVEIEDQSSDVYVLQIEEEEEDVKPKIEKPVRRRLKRKSDEEVKFRKEAKRKTVGEHPDILYNMKDHFDIEKLSVYEQIKDWEKTARRADNQEEVFECDVCSKQFATKIECQRHTAVHDAKRGTVECPVCKSLFKNQKLMRSHILHSHANMYYCKTCPLFFSGLRSAKKHLRWHVQDAYESAKDGKETDPEKAATDQFRCEQCDLSFKSEQARRFHLLTSRQHKKKPVLRKRTLNDPGKHPRKEPLSSAKDYPKTCELCGVCVSTRRKYYWHVRIEHPREHSHRAKINFVCHSCGKGYQNITNLRLHELRHRNPTVKCEFCPKLFHDKYSLAYHVTMHSEARPHRCRTCGLSFKKQSNLLRHYKVHSDVAAYDCSLCGKKFKYTDSLNLHVRTVHHKIPLPPRKRTRTKGTANIE